MLIAMDPLSTVVDEVALEGLDGITIPTLWIRLGTVQPKFPLKLDELTKEFIWKSLVNNRDLRFYELPQERPDVQLFNRFGENDSDISLETQLSSADDYKDIYSLHVIPENKDGIQGSCNFFKERKDITKQIRSVSLTPLVSLEEASKKYGRKLVIVASQAVRFRALIGAENDPDLKMSNDSYCVLERVGRARWQGELQSNLHNGLFSSDARKLHYLRKPLVKHDLITLQPFSLRLKSGQQQHTLLLLLKRFHLNRRTKYDKMMEYVSDFLQQFPGQFTTVDAFKQHLNLSETVLRTLIKNLRAAGMTEFIRYPLEDLDPEAGPCINKNGNKVLVRCLKLVKPYSKKDIPDVIDDDDDEDNMPGGSKLSTEGRVLERDIISQAYHLVLSCGTKGIPQRDITSKMNIGNLESRMIIRKLERDGLIKGFMVDEGRQRTTKYLSHKCVGVSDQLLLFAQERERNKLLYSAANKSHDAPPAKKSKKKGQNKEQEGQGGRGDAETARVDQNSGEASGESKEEDMTEQMQPEPPIMQPAPDDGAIPSINGSMTSVTLDPVTPSKPEGPSAVIKEQEFITHSDAGSCEAQTKAEAKATHETYRGLRRKNLIVEAVQNFKVIEGFIQLQKMISDEEKKDGISSKCCKKTILRLVQSMSRKGLLKIYTTTVIQDGITKKVDIIVHPSIQSNDERISQLIDQVRFKISSSSSVVRKHEASENSKKQATSKDLFEGQKDKGVKNRKSDEGETPFKPTKVSGLGKTFGYQPKMCRLRVLHTFIWHVIYGHPLLNDPPDAECTAEATELNKSSLHGSNPEPQNKPTQGETSGVADLDKTLGDEEELPNDQANPGPSESNMKVYVDEESWKRFVPPARLQKGFSRGWVMVGDLLLCIPLSVFTQIININYKVDGLEEYLSDPVKQHHLVRWLPGTMKRQLLYKRRYISLLTENLQKLIYMGLLQFGIAEKFMERDQMFVYLKRNATIVDTTHAEPHYWLVKEPPDKPFERRRYTFSTADDVGSFWFDLMCICLDTPLGVIRNKRNPTKEEAALHEPHIVQDRKVFLKFAHLLRGSFEVCDDGSIPGDGRGAGGLDSEFFSHLKRNWYWTNHLLELKKRLCGAEDPQIKMRLKNLVSKPLRAALQAEGTVSPQCLTMKRSLATENFKVGVEPASRNQKVIGGKGQKRKRLKKEVVKVAPKKRKQAKKRSNAHDETDHKALKMMTKQRVYWSAKEDALIMLCSVASRLLNNKLKRPFVPYCVVRDMLHAAFKISEDKTSIAVGRRSKYILKNPQTLLNYRICLAEVQQDKTLMKHLEEKKPADPNKAEDCAKVFSEYVKLLREKFSSVMNTDGVTIPDSKQELFSRFKVSAIDSGTRMPLQDTLTCQMDIHTIVLHNLIQSTLAMTSAQMKSSRSFQTFHMYNKYDQELLCRVFLQCRKRRLINRRRLQKTSVKKSRGMPILPMSYQLSQSFYRWFSWRFPQSLCTESFCFLRSLLTYKTGDERPATTFYHETESRSRSGEETSERKAESAKKSLDDKKVQHPAATNAESFKEGEDDQRRVEEKEELKVAGVNEEKTEETRMSESPESQAGALTTGSDDAPLSGERGDGPPESPVVQAPHPPSDASDMLQFSLSSPGGACVASLSLMTLGLLSVHVSIPKPIVVVDSTLVDNDFVKSMAALEEEDDDEDEDGDNEGRKKLQVTAHQASHTNYLMMQGYYSPGIVKMRNLSTNDNIVVESCTLRLQLRSTPSHRLFTEENSPSLDLTKCGPSLLPRILTRHVRSPCCRILSAEECNGVLIQEKGYTQQDIEACARLRISLDEAGEKGLDEREIYRVFMDLLEPQSGRSTTLQLYLKDLQEGGQLVRVGGLGVRWVLMQHAEPWLLTVNSQHPPVPHSPSEKPPFMKGQHNIPFLRKRSSREQHREGPPSKRPAVHQENGADAVNVDAGEKPNEEEKLEEQLEKSEGAEEQEVAQAQLMDEQEEVGKEVLETRKQVDQLSESNTRKDRREKLEEECSPQDKEEESLSFISRPWRLIDGSVNRAVCKGMLEGLLYHIMSQPGLTQQALLEHYRTVLQPVAVLDLVQALVELGCVVKKSLVKEPKPSLFSRSAHQSRTNRAGEVGEPDEVFYEPTISCCLRLSQVLPNERHWNDCC
ncbi:general transcription factor 3C polypeptide 1 isoform X3 [Oryzias latipes]|uniref:general transcription factor 3C polypeptide 1 isoform X3 n=1 Tax=Oryzias latipes TaxID=8090 RepID=UPI000CE26228|nr:general transcription factor 3C polypeptide 1 isoform X3 [Oryzias latipes]